MEELSGGREAAIYRKGDVIYRKAQRFSPTIHRVLEHLHSQNFLQSPQFLGIDGPYEKLSYVEGDCYNYPLRGAIASDQAIISSAKLLRSLHDATVSFIHQNDIEQMDWMLEVRTPVEVICHGDFTPYNVALKGNEVTGVFDFDTAHPGPRIWDLAYSIYCWSPFKTDPNDKLGSLDDQIARAKLFCDSYDASTSMRQQLAAAMIERLQALVDFMRQQAAQDNQQFAQDIEQGHLIAYLNDIEYIKENRVAITRGLLGS
ncbi:aminoglycoside phosphotransferase family protein [Vibrio sp. SCSIO 43136]|uniref:aminoglycoside phosphotransferase family protein n=1 Tax=Vibrio sp. SCSIO 43136 TaxID=2819101 RepID=UPI002076180F|nr:aminoglycoside phosphotransferase family protein [Vibrio sp. SCSIO 43136]USD64053.1 aminoglycoside phosphotransferase family protein [Vibrio sp. SCSIO 43136]